MIYNNRDTVLGQVLSRTDAGEKKELGCIDGASADDCVFGRVVWCGDVNEICIWARLPRQTDISFLLAIPPLQLSCLRTEHA